MASRFDGRPTLRALVSSEGLPEREPLPRWLAPLPEAVENLGLNLAGLVAAINLGGTAFGFWYYHEQLAYEPLVAWPVVPDSPVATLFIALALLAWTIGRPSEYLNALAFFGCWKLGLWTPFVLAVFATDPAPGFLGANPLWLYLFMFFSHLAMVVQAFVLHRISGFPVRAVAVAAGWYAFNDVVDYLVPIGATPHHTWLVGRTVEGGLVVHPPAVQNPAAAAAVVLTVSATFLALATRVKKLEDRRASTGA